MILKVLVWVRLYEYEITNHRASQKQPAQLKPEFARLVPEIAIEHHFER